MAEYEDRINREEREQREERELRLLRAEYLDLFSELRFDSTDEDRPLSEYFVRARQLRAGIDEIINLFKTKLHSKDELDSLLFALVAHDKVELLRCLIDGRRIRDDFLVEEYHDLLDRMLGGGSNWVLGRLVLWLTTNFLWDQISILTPATKRLKKTINKLQDDLYKMRRKLHKLCKAAVDSLNRGLKLCLEHGINLSIRDSGGGTLLHYTASQKILDMIFKDGDDMNVRNREGQTPLHTFIIDIHGQCETYELEFIEVLVKKGADIDATDELGLTPLHIATSKRHSSIVHRLLFMGADMNIESKEGKTALDMIQPRNYRSCLYYSANRMKLEAAGYYVSKKNLDHNLTSNVSDDLDLYNFKLSCENEVQELKSNKFSRCMSLFDILHTNDPRYVINRTLMGINFDSDYPIYHRWLNMKIKNDEELFGLLEPATRALRVVCRTSSALSKQAIPNLLDELELKIVCYLKARDIRNLITCAQKIEKQVEKSRIQK